MKPIYNKKRDFKALKRFAFLPKRLSSGILIFWEYYIIIEHKLSPKQDLHPSISVPDKPFWVEVHSEIIPDIGVVPEDIIIAIRFEEFLRNTK